MLRATLCSLVVLALPVLAAQIPLSQADLRRPEAGRHRLGDEEWNFDRLPSPNATDHLVFETVHSLLQHWPNTRMRNGHNIVPGRIPKGTLLYHGTSKNEIPQGPDWVATDPEHSYVFCRDAPDHPHQGCWHLTLATTRSLRVIYFDGSSAAKVPYGAMDTQDLIAWGVSDNHDVFDEDGRLQNLCEWGRKFGIDGFVRMEMDFEAMLCDLTAGVSVVSFLNLVSGNDKPTNPSPVSFEVMSAGSWHNHFPGEARVQLDLSGLVSFYDVQLAPSLVGIRAGQERWDHRVRSVSSEDLSAVKSRLEAVLTRPEGLSSGIDWRTLVRVIVDRYAGRLELMRYLLGLPATNPNQILDLANKTQTQLKIMVTPYRTFSTTPTNQSDRSDLDWTIPIYKLCATTHTYSMESEIGSMTDSERLLLQAVRETTREICRVVTKMWAAGVYAGVDLSLNPKDLPDIADVTRLLNTWTEDLNRLMAWLDWNVWVKCDPGCGFEEMCWLPTWPIGFPMNGGLPYNLHPHGSNFDFRTVVTEGLAGRMRHSGAPGPDDWIRPQPRCVRRVDPYDI